MNHGVDDPSELARLSTPSSERTRRPALGDVATITDPT